MVGKVIALWQAITSSCIRAYYTIEKKGRTSSHSPNRTLQLTTVWNGLRPHKVFGWLVPLVYVQGFAAFSPIRATVSASTSVPARPMLMATATLDFEDSISEQN
jgi:hypothetical protein